MALFQKSSTQTPEKVLENAHVRAEKIVADAIKDAEKIFTEMGKTNRQMKKQTEEFFKKTQDVYMTKINESVFNFEQSYAQLIPEIREKYFQSITAMTEKLRADVLAQVPSTKTSLDAELKTINMNFQKKIDAEWESIQKEIQAYKEAKYKEIDKAVEKKITSIAREAFGEALTDSQKHQLVVAALEKAAKDGMFGNE